MSTKTDGFLAKMKQFFAPTHIGMRKWKSILALFISFLVWQVIRLFFPDLEVHPIYMYIYGVVEIRDSSEKTVDFSGRRLKANICGFAIGLPLLALMDLLKAFTPAGWVHLAIEITLILIGALITITVAQKAGCQNFCGIAAILFVVLFVSHCDDGRYLYCLLRALQTVLAIFIAWLLNVKLFPYPEKPKKTPETKQ